MSRPSNPFVQWAADLRWAMNMMAVRRFRRGLGFSQRVKFDAALRPRRDPPAVIAYPDAIYHAKADDVTRARSAVHASR